MKILVYGAGVLGSLYGAWLQESGQDVTVLARGQRLEEIRQHGIVLEDVHTGHRTFTRVNTTHYLAPEDAYDLVIVLMRKSQVAEILPVLAANQNTPNVLFMVNNAAGPELYTNALGGERVLLGFPGAGGTREGYVVRYLVLPASRQATSIGELDGQITPRLEKIAAALITAGFGVVMRENMDAWLKTHVALVSPIANAVYLAGGSNYRLARTQDGILLLVRAVKEGLSVLRALRIPVTPTQFNLLRFIPEPVLVLSLKKILPLEAVEIVVSRHANAARDEMKQLADEFQLLAGAAAAPTPAINQLYTFIDPGVPPMPEGSKELRVDWRGVLAPLMIGLGAVLAVRKIKNRRSS